MDHRTLFICLVTLLALNTVAFFLLHLSERRLSSVGWMSAAFGSFTLGIGMGAARGFIDDFYSIVLGNSFAVIGYILLHRAVTDFLGLGWRDRGLNLAVAGLFVAGVSWFTYGQASLAARIVLAGLAVAVLAGTTSYRLLSEGGRTEVRDATRFLGAVLAGVAVLHLWRIAATLRRDNLTNLMGGSTAEALVLLAMLASISAVAFGFIWMTGSRLRFMLHQQAHRDPLTGLLNRRGFLASATAQLNGMTEAGHALLLYADLDGLKDINDNMGHDAGDKALVAVANILEEELRASDNIARLGGDEFSALVLTSSLPDGEAILERLERRVQALNSEGVQYRLGLSAAFTDISGKAGLSMEELLIEADQRMYEAKRQRKSQAALA